MRQDSASFQELINEASLCVGEAGAEVQKYIVLPALMDIMGPIQGKEILEVYCGAGFLSRRFASMGATVTGVDSSVTLIDIANEINSREAVKINYINSESNDLSAIEDSAYDEIICNMGMMMTRDLGGTIAELARLIKMGGRFIFSILHPCFHTPDSCWAGDEDGRFCYRTIDNYFTDTWWTSELASNIRSGRNKVKHRPLFRYINALGARGFTVRRVIEPRPSPEILAIKPQLEVFNRIPAAIIIEAIFPYL